jgi:branched-chain amino acid transport system substrate-binding protein
MNNNKIYTTILLGALFTGISSSYANDAVTETIKIGVSGPFTGGSAPMGESMRGGIRLAIDEINGFVGGFQGRKFELIERDDQAKNDVGARIAEEFVQKKVIAAIGIVNTGVGLASIDTYQNAKIPLMIAVATGTTLTKKYAPPAAAENYIFRSSPTLDLEAKILANDLKVKNLSKIAILADATAYGAAGLKAFKEQSAAAGLILTTEDRFNIGDKDMNMQVAHAKESGAQAIVVWGIGPELAVIAKNKEAQGWKVPMLGSWTLSMDNFTQIAGKAGDGVQFPQTFVQNYGQPSKDYFLNSYYAKFNTARIPSPMSAAQGYDGMFLLYRAMLQAQSTEGKKIKEALENLKYRYDGAITRYKRPFSATDHNAITQNMYFMCKVNAGRIDYLYSEDEKRATFMRSKQK